jgi:phosphoribosylanthranilate isomerase
VIHVTGSESEDEAITASMSADAILLDSGNQALAVKELGGTGRVHDWTLSRHIREQAKGPLFLAGGLTPQNIRQAIEDVGAFGVDLCSGVRTDGNLDSAKMQRFFEIVNSVA